MIRKVTMYQAVCDGCGKAHVNDNMGYCACDSGWTEIDGKPYCTDCYEYDEETDEYKPKNKD